MILLIDNYDSFTYNLYHQIASQGKEVKIVRNDAITIDEIRAIAPEAIVISPGPGTPREAGNIIEIIKALYKEIPLLGVCLGHQAIGEALGAKIVLAKSIKHGKNSRLHKIDAGLMADISGPIDVMRYHSLVIDKETLPNDLIISAFSIDDEEIMAIHHDTYPVFGVQFHPESIGTERGDEVIRSFLKTCFK